MKYEGRLMAIRGRSHMMSATGGAGIQPISDFF